MDTVRLNIHIVQPPIDPAQFGSNLSTTDKILVNKVRGTYSVVYEEAEFAKLRVGTFVNSLVRILQENLPNTVVQIEILYHCNEVDEEVGSMVIGMDQYIKTASLPNIQYVENPAITDIMDEIDNVDSEEDDEDDDDDEEEDEAEEPVEEIEDKQQYDIWSSWVDNPEYKTLKRKSKHYETSQVLLNSKNAKKSIKRHGVLTANRKSDIKDDEKAIKEFLKDFIPGNSEWKREFRAELCKRWISVFAVSKKELKKLESNYRKSRNHKKTSAKKKKLAKQVTRHLLYNDEWNDPTR